MRLEITKQRGDKSEVWEIGGAIIVFETVLLIILGNPLPLVLIIGILYMMNIARYFRQIEAAQEKQSARGIKPVIS